MNTEANKHHRRSVRLPGFDYFVPGGYYITIVTQGRMHLFGEVDGGEMGLSQAGKIAEACWHAIPEHFPQAELGAFVVMPNHVHGIIVLHERADTDASENGLAAKSPPTVGARHGVPLPANNIEKFSKSVSGSLATIIRQYKSSVTREVVQQFGGAPSVWQRNFYEHVIRDEQDHQRVHDYILNNPFNWETDDENVR